MSRKPKYLELSEIPLTDLLMEIKSRGLITNSKKNEEIINSKSTSIKIILSFGLPSENLECRECGECKSPTNFTFYQGRVDNKGFLMRSNALCYNCMKKTNEQRKLVLDRAIIPQKPKPGDVCTNCNREWSGNWHRHHVGNEFISYICGHCNMSFSDQRNKVVLKK